MTVSNHVKALAIGTAALLVVSVDGEASAQGRRSVTDGPHIGRCHMGGCSWFEVTRATIVRSVPAGRLVRLTTREGGSEHGNNRYPNNSRGVRIRWSPPADDYYVFCSVQKPAVIMGRDGGGWSATAIAPASPYGVTEFITSLYNHVCHPGVTMTEARSRSLGYRAGEADAPDIELTRPEDIIGR